MKRYLPLIIFVLLVIGFRILGSAFPESFPNFQPVAALFFCGALMMKGWKSWAIPLGAWLVSYPAPAIFSGNAGYLGPLTILMVGLGFAATYFMGKGLSGKGASIAIVGSIFAGAVFHIVTNGIIWISSPLYPNNLTGLYQSLWAGPLGSPIPSWVFFRNMAVANVLFTSILLSSSFALPKFLPSREPSQAR